MDFTLTVDDPMRVRYAQMQAMGNEAMQATQQCQAAIARQSTCIKISREISEAVGKALV
jgi:hypothetical protein